MLTLALTGGIGSGKSHVAAIWARLGAHVVDADRTARAILEPGSPALAKIAERWGEQVFDDGVLNRQALAAIVFEDAASRKALDDITHPVIWTSVNEQIEAVRREDPDGVVVYDVPLLAGYGREFEMIANVSIAAAPEIRAQRLHENRAMSEADARARIAAQATDEERSLISDLTIVNDADEPSLQSAAGAAWEGWILPFAGNLRSGSWTPTRLCHPALAVNDDVGLQLARLRYHGVRPRGEAGLAVIGTDEAMARAGWVWEGSSWRLANPALDLRANVSRGQY
ncbi:MAG: dephospho-CoA kinase [Trueperella sp.]|uniref:dephospho-CoA kinase n=1 Tax=Trueperella sp. TaxID=2699835 RepID=UPI002A9190D7|nr:dephospho-CoA kinase [Trueperella sp.]MDY5404270.1 dephospho-CoA kinase [Trueperella sp.]